jgi:ArsR family transcriptional regulator
MDESTICESTVIHKDTIKKVKLKLIEANQLTNLANYFKLLSDPTRITVLHALSISEMCVCDLSVLITLSQSAISHQLRILRQANLVKFRNEERKVVYYSLLDERVHLMVNIGLRHINEK